MFDINNVDVVSKSKTDIDPPLYQHINSPMPMSTSLSEVFNKSEFSLLWEFFERNNNR